MFGIIIENPQIPCQFFVLCKEKFCEIALPNFKDFKNGETSVVEDKLIIIEHHTGNR